MKTCLAVLIFACAAGAHAADFSVRQGDIELTLDDATGTLVRISYKGEAIATPPAGRSPVSFGVGPQDKIKWFENFAAKGTGTVVKREQPAPDTLELTIRGGDFELIERYKLFADQARIDRSVTLTNRGTEAVKLRNFNFKTLGVAASKDGFYRLPQQWPPASHPLAEIKQGVKRGGHGALAPLVVQLTPSRSLVWFGFANDHSGVRLEEGAGQFDVVQDVYACGFLKPNQPQEIGFVSMMVVEAGYWDALPFLWKYMDSVGLKVPADRPEWVKDAILYCFHPGGTIGSNFKDLGGFKNATEFLLPTIPKLGANAIWIMPIEQKSPYWPFDYYKFMDGLGTGDDYKALVKKAHELGLHVWQDMVPHGGSPKAVHNVAHPEFMLHREDGSTLNYWLNDFALPAWQKFMADVATHYCREYGVDGFRVDACGGSKEANWNPDIPYARASHALLMGGIGMMGGIRKAVRDAQPKEGAILAEAENARLLGVCDAEYDFDLCYNVLHQWRKMPAADFVAYLQDYLEEQKYSDPRGTIRLRHVESHDSLRAELWYGVDGMHAVYALSAWIDGMPLMYHGMENGHSFALREINEIRKSRPELSRGEAFYRAVKCDAPGVFTCLRKLGDKQTVFAINFGRHAVKAKLEWPEGKAELALEPLEYTVVPRTPPPARRAEIGSGLVGRDSKEIVLPDAVEWVVDTISGRLHGEVAPYPVLATAAGSAGIYWRPQGTSVVWRQELQPLYPDLPMAVRNADDKWMEVVLQNPSLNLRLERGEKGLRVAGLGTRPAPEIPAPCPTGAPLKYDAVTFRCVGPDLIVSNKHYTVVLRRQGGVIRELMGANGKVVAKDNDLYGDQEYFKPNEDWCIAASNDVECSLRIEKMDKGLKLSFEGQLRGFQRFSLKRPPLLFRNEYTFTDAPSFHQKYAFRTEKSFKDKAAFLTSVVILPSAEKFRFLRGNEPPVEDVVGQTDKRRGETRGKPAPERAEFLGGGTTQFALSSLRVPEGSDCNAFIHGRQFFLTLFDTKTAAMEQGKWCEFEADWETGK